MTSHDRQHSIEHNPSQGELMDLVPQTSGLTDSTNWKPRYAVGELHPEGIYPSSSADVTSATTQEVVAPAADSRLRARYLETALGHFAGASMRHGFEKAVHTDTPPHLKPADDLQTLGRGVTFNKHMNMRHAREAFLNAYNLGRERPVTAKDDEFIDDFEAFSQRYGLGANPEQTAIKRDRRERLRKTLSKIAGIPGELQQQTYAIADSDFSTEGSGIAHMRKALEYTPAQTKEKLIGLRDDTRASFLPTTHREKSQAFELLSYMEPGRYEHGISSRLDEIFFKQQTEMQKKGMTPHESYDVATNTVRSVVNEWGDYLLDSRSSWQKLTRLGRLISDTPNPRLSLEEMLDAEGQGETLAQLIRHDVLRKFRDGDENKSMGFDPLWVREDRSHPTPDKHKTVEDVFSHQNEQFMADYVRRRAQQMTVREVRDMVIEAIADQVSRGTFWHKVLESLNEDYQPYAQAILNQRS